jgi:hypothetical protein
MSVRVVALATSFIHVRSGGIPSPVTISWMTIGVVSLVSSLVLIPILGGLPGPNPILRIATVALGALFSFQLLLVARAAFRVGMPINLNDIPRWVEERVPQWLEEIHSPSMDNDTLMVVRASGDEATSVLIASQFFSLVSSKLTAASKWRGWVAFPILAFVGSYVLISNIEAASTVAILLPSAIVFVFALPLFLVALFMMTAALPFGTDGPLASIFAFMSAEATPPGRVDVVQLQPLSPEMAAGGGSRRRRGMSHSSLYDDPAVISHIAAVVRQWQGVET